MIIFIIIIIIIIIIKTNMIVVAEVEGLMNMGNLVSMLVDRYLYM